MIERVVLGEVPRKHHIALRSAEGALRWEECLTQEGFEGPYTICYHANRPHEHRAIETTHGWTLPRGGEGERRLAKRHFKSNELPVTGGAPVDTRAPIVWNEDVTISVSRPDRDDPVYVVNAEADTLVWCFEGAGTLRTPLGDVAFAKDDYVCVPRGLVHRFLVSEPSYWLVIECAAGVRVPRQWRNDVGQLRMDAPYSHRDFRKPRLDGARDEGIREVVVKRHGAFHGFEVPHTPLDVVGWDGTVYPWAFHILDFQARAGLVHLPPTWHGTFATRGALICSFVPRVVDFHPEAVPCPYPHSSVDVDEVLFYARGNFTSRRGVGPGSMSFHPAGIPHGPHPGAYEKSIGHARTDELAVMLDCERPLRITREAESVEDAAYMASFRE